METNAHAWKRKLVFSQADMLENGDKTPARLRKESGSSSGPGVGSPDEGPNDQAYSRKDKSLGRLCENFLNLYGRCKDDDSDEVCLDAAAQKLGVERRRIYDIVNVLESVGVVVRKAKNRYTWHGANRLEETLSALKDAALSPTKSCNDGGVTDLQFTPQNTPVKNQESESETKKGSGGNRKDKSLGKLSQRFVQLFLTAGDSVVSIDQAASALLGSDVVDVDSSIHKTKVRRLYDIANILTSLSLITKTQTSDKKPGFRWLGPNAANIAPDTDETNSRAPKARYEEREKPVLPNAKKRKSKSSAVTPTPVDLELSEPSPTAILSGPSQVDPEEHAQQWDDAMRKWKKFMEAEDSNCHVQPFQQCGFAEWASRFDVDDYMRRAKASGPEYFEKAKTWLRDFDKW
eukprot:CAMPEP_0184678248 /NCGR_PEP_ID=MMETSP0312-20130426/969_1 /TAXON_ID=31354 /ORGANISM="Compsopogon coeruleus, Strain SAG 36.94" /LENGTH=403 /DNA_ID=CAMNT_0027126837 /DNA_START=282 /DNA_END=1490 /DNA_ORIENTATION=+